MIQSNLLAPARTIHGDTMGHEERGEKLYGDQGGNELLPRSGFGPIRVKHTDYAIKTLVEGLPAPSLRNEAKSHTEMTQYNTPLITEAQRWL